MARRLFGRLLGKGRKESVGRKEIEEEKRTELERVCGNDEEVYKALRQTMFLDPRKITVTLEEAAEKAADSEKKKDDVNARKWYQIAGGLALWKGDISKVKQYFGSCAKLAPNMGFELITKIPEKAVSKAQEYYKNL